jgi:hypothetical protein
MDDKAILVAVDRHSAAPVECAVDEYAGQRYYAD